MERLLATLPYKRIIKMLFNGLNLHLWISTWPPALCQSRRQLPVFTCALSALIYREPFTKQSNHTRFLFQLLFLFLLSAFLLLRFMCIRVGVWREFTLWYRQRYSFSSCSSCFFFQGQKSENEMKVRKIWLKDNYTDSVEFRNKSGT